MRVVGEDDWFARDVNSDDYSITMMLATNPLLEDMLEIAEVSLTARPPAPRVVRVPVTTAVTRTPPTTDSPEERARCQQEVEELTQENEQLTEDNEQLLNTARRLQLELQTAESGTAGQRIRELVDELAREIEKRKVAEEQRAEAMRRTTALEGVLEKNGERIAELERDVTEFEELLGQCEETAAGDLAVIKRLQEELQQAGADESEQVQRLRQENLDAGERNDRLTLDVDNTARQLEERNARVAELEAVIQEKDRQLEEADAQATNRVKELQSEVQSLKETLQQTNEQLREAQGTINSVRKENAKVEKRARAAETAEAELREKLENAESESDQKDREIAQLKESQSAYMKAETTDEKRRLTEETLDIIADGYNTRLDATATLIAGQVRYILDHLIEEFLSEIVSDRELFEGAAKEYEKTGNLNSILSLVPLQENFRKILADPSNSASALATINAILAANHRCTERMVAYGTLLDEYAERFKKIDDSEFDKAVTQALRQSANFGELRKLYGMPPHVFGQELAGKVETNQQAFERDLRTQRAELRLEEATST